MSTMKPETVYGDWIVIDGDYGVSVYPGEYFDEIEAKADYGGRVYECETITGWAARLSMPGFIDSTDWQGPYDSENAALQDVETIYGC